MRAGSLRTIRRGVPSRLNGGMIDRMGIWVELVEGTQPLTFPDPSGGTFDAAGDFDRLLPAYGDRAFPVLGHIDTEGYSQVGQSSMAQLLTEIDLLLPLAKTRPESRGLLRLRTLVEHCAESPSRTLRFVGD